MRSAPLVAWLAASMCVGSCALSHTRSSDAGPPTDVMGLLHVTLTEVSVMTNGLPGGGTSDRATARWRVVVTGGEGPSARLVSARIRFGHAPGIEQTLVVDNDVIPLTSGSGTIVMMKRSGSPAITSAMVGAVCSDAQIELTIVLRINGHDFETAVTSTNACTR